MLKGRGRLFNLPEGGFVGPVNEAVAAHLRRLILSGAITPRARLPSQRIMAQDFRVSRNTIVAALAQLTSEGLLEARVGAGTYVVASPPRARAYDNEPGARAPARKGALPLEAGMPDVSLFPFELWRKALDLSARGVAQASYLESSGGGWAPLRDLIAARVAAMRGVACSGDQVIVTASSQAAIELAARALAAPGDAAWMEDPGYHRARDALKNAGLAVTPVPVDEDGFDVVEAERRARAKIAYVTACAQMPTGAAMSERRRAALMQWASAADGWIVEDDFEADFPLDGRAPTPIAARRDAKRVILVGTFNNLIFPALHIAYLIAPTRAIGAFLKPELSSLRAANLQAQCALETFMEKGWLAAHIRQCRQLFRERRDALAESMARRLAGRFAVSLPKQGLLVQAWGEGDRAIRLAAAKRGVIVNAMSDHAMLPARSGLFLGFAPYAPAAIDAAVVELARAVEDADRAGR